MLFELTNAPVTFQSALYLVLFKFKRQTCLIYLTNIIFFFKNFDTHIEQVDEVLAYLEAAEFTLKAKKFSFSTTVVECLVHITAPGQPKVDTAKAKSPRKTKPLTSKLELTSFLGLRNV